LILQFCREEAFDAFAKEAVDEELFMADFPRVSFDRELISFDDEGQPS